MQDALELRTATPQDYDFLYALHRETMHAYIEATWGWDEEWQRTHFERDFRPAANQILLLDGHKIGRIEVDTNADSVHIGNIQIRPPYQNQGIGRLVVLKIIEQAQSQKQPVTLQVLKVNPARRFYERLGFVVVGEDDAHYKMRRE